MSETLNFLTDFIRLDIFMGFDYYSILFYPLQVLLMDNTFLIDFDKSAVQMIVYGGFIWFVLWLVQILNFYFDLEGIEKINYYERLTGAYQTSLFKAKMKIARFAKF